ncbi:hypothetical protein FJY71_03640 [candidate division WOR-3 bacterium]|nr:hypothetical protein [candidate division WOR-3 bacterium]
MPIQKVRKSDGLHCLWCNAFVQEADASCPACGRQFAAPAATPQTPVLPSFGQAQYTAPPEDRRSPVGALIAGAVLFVIGLVLMGEGGKGRVLGEFISDRAKVFHYLGLAVLLAGLVVAAVGAYRLISTSSGTSAGQPRPEGMTMPLGGRYCTQCGRQIRPMDTFCSGCGRRAEPGG